jgi:hypothetical protein
MTTALLLLKAQYPWLQFGPLYSDGAVNFKSFLFALILAEVSKRTGFRVTAHLLPEAGDGKDRCDRDFVGVNKLFDSWVKADRRVMLSADDICDALETGVTPGVINCALETQRDEAAEKVWKDNLNTGRFAEVVGKKKEDLFYIDLVWEEGETGWQCIGMRFFCYHEMGTGKLISTEQLREVHPGPKPPVLTYTPNITRGTTVDGSKVATEVKIEMSREHKRRKKSAREEKRCAAEAEAALREEQKEAERAAHRTSFRCAHCDKPMLRNRMTSSLHQASCSKVQQKLSVDQKEEILKGDSVYKFGVLEGCGQMLKPSSDALVPLTELCSSSNQAVLSVLKKQCSHVEYSVACCVRDLVDTLMFTSGESYEMPLLGWACREANVRATKQFDSSVVDQLRWCFDQSTRMSSNNIEKHLKMHFGLYAGPTRCLRASQISGWISSELGRRKKALLGLSVTAVVKAAEEVSVGAVEAPEIGVELACIEMVKIRNLEAMRKRLDDFKAHWRARRPEPEVTVEEEQPEIEVDVNAKESGKKKRKRAPCKASAPVEPIHPAPVAEVAEVTEVTNKRGRRCDYEYECRWSNKGADETSWESADELLSTSARRAVQAFEDHVEGRSRTKLLMGQLICEKCNSVIEKVDSRYESKGKYECKDEKACELKKLHGLNEDKTTRHRRSCRSG